MKFLTFEYDFDKYNITVKNYDQLIKELKLLNIKPQEAFDLAFKNKFQFNARYHWTMKRIGLYLNKRYFFTGMIVIEQMIYPTIGLKQIQANIYLLKVKVGELGKYQSLKEFGIK